MPAQPWIYRPWCHWQQERCAARSAHPEQHSTQPAQRLTLTSDEPAVESLAGLGKAAAAACTAAPSAPPLPAPLPGVRPPRPAPRPAPLPPAGGVAAAAADGTAAAAGAAAAGAVAATACCCCCCSAASCPSSSFLLSAWDLRARFSLPTSSVCCKGAGGRSVRQGHPGRVEATALLHGACNIHLGHLHAAAPCPNHTTITPQACPSSHTCRHSTPAAHLAHLLLGLRQLIAQLLQARLGSLQRRLQRSHLGLSCLSALLELAANL